jgi:hypothetical protein
MTLLNAAERTALPDSAFVFPDREPREYPIQNLEHADDALSRSSGTPDEAAVKKAVYARYPQLNPALKGARGTNKPFTKA